MTLLHSELSRVEKQLKMLTKLFLFSIIIAFIACIISYKLGVTNQEIKTINRAQKVLGQDKILYTAEDVEFIALGDSNADIQRN